MSHHSFLSLIIPALVASLCPGQAAEIRNITIPSKALQREAPLTIVLPDDYGKSEKKYPVIYFLHGHGDNNTHWVSRIPLIPQLADELGFIAVCPDGQKSWYFNSYTNPANQFETHIAQEIVPYIDKNFRTIATRDCRAITGNSMGGHGALYLGTLHPQLFAQIGSLSGGVNIIAWPKGFNIADSLGAYEQNTRRWEDGCILHILPKTKPDTYRNILISCGDQDFFLQDNKRLDEKLTQAGIRHTFTITPGAHNWTYWKAAATPQIRTFIEAMPLGKPAPPKHQTAVK